MLRNLPQPPDPHDESAPDAATAAATATAAAESRWRAPTRMERIWTRCYSKLPGYYAGLNRQKLEAMPLELLGEIEYPERISTRLLSTLSAEQFLHFKPGKHIAVLLKVLQGVSQGYIEGEQSLRLADELTRLLSPRHINDVLDKTQRRLLDLNSLGDGVFEQLTDATLDSFSDRQVRELTLGNLDAGGLARLARSAKTMRRLSPRTFLGLPMRGAHKEFFLDNLNRFPVEAYSRMTRQQKALLTAARFNAMDKARQEALVEGSVPFDSKEFLERHPHLMEPEHASIEWVEANALIDFPLLVIEDLDPGALASFAPALNKTQANQLRPGPDGRFASEVRLRLSRVATRGLNDAHLADYEVADLHELPREILTSIRLRGLLPEVFRNLGKRVYAKLDSPQINEYLRSPHPGPIPNKFLDHLSPGAIGFLVLPEDPLIRAQVIDRLSRAWTEEQIQSFPLGQLTTQEFHALPDSVYAMLSDGQIGGHLSVYGTHGIPDAETGLIKPFEFTPRVKANVSTQAIPKLPAAHIQDIAVAIIDDWPADKLVALTRNPCVHEGIYARLADRAFSELPMHIRTRKAEARAHFRRLRDRHDLGEFSPRTRVAPEESHPGDAPGRAWLRDPSHGIGATPKSADLITALNLDAAPFLMAWREDRFRHASYEQAMTRLRELAARHQSDRIVQALSTNAGHGAARAGAMESPRPPAELTFSHGPSHALPLRV